MEPLMTSGRSSAAVASIVQGFPPVQSRLSGEIHRRDVLRVAAGLGLSFLLPALDLRAARRRGNERPKSLITLWLAGGPSQLETWDPHPAGKVGDTFRAIPTRTPELQISELYPRVAEQIDSLSVIRSLVSKEGDHERGTYHLKTGYRPDPTVIHPAVGAIAAHELPEPSIEIPQYVSLGAGQWPGRGGYLGAAFDAFKVFDPGRNISNMRPLSLRTGSRSVYRISPPSPAPSAAAVPRAWTIRSISRRSTAPSA